MFDANKPRNTFLIHLQRSSSALTTKLDQPTWDRFSERLAKSEGGEPLITPSREEEYLVVLIEGSLGLNGAFRELELAVAFLKNSETRPSEISHSEYVHYHLEGILNVIYQFANRAEVFFKRTSRVYAKSELAPTLAAWAERSLQDLTEPLEWLIEIRGEHVHKKDYTDSDLALLNLGDQMMSASKASGLDLVPQSFSSQLDNLCRSTAQRRGELYGKLVGALDGLMDRIYRELISIIGTQDQKFRSPK